MSVNDVKPLPLNVEFLKLYSCQILLSSELSNLLCKVSGRKNNQAAFSFAVLCIMFYCLAFFGAVGLFRSDMLLIFYMVWP